MTMHPAGLPNTEYPRALSHNDTTDTTAFDWPGFEQFVVGAITGAVAEWTATHRGSRPRRASLCDFHVRGMLILFPAIAIDGRPRHHRSWRPQDWAWQRDADRDGDAWAGRITASIGSGRGRWDEVVAQFFRSLVSASRTATTYLQTMEAVEPEFLTVVINEASGGDDTDDLIVRSIPADRLATEFPAVAARRAEASRMAGLDTDDRVRELVAVLDDRNAAVLNRDDAVRMLAACGSPGVDATTERLVYCDLDALPHWLAVFDELDEVGDDVVARLRAVVADPAFAQQRRAGIASSLAWHGRLTDLIDVLPTLPEDVVLRVLARPYLGTHRNGGTHKKGRLAYAPVEQALIGREHLDGMLVEMLSPTSMYAIDSDDVAVVMAGLSSPWAFVRRHASIVLLTVHI
ncbi:hypothetical protein [Gordonia sputi]